MGKKSKVDKVIGKDKAPKAISRKLALMFARFWC